MYSVLLVDDHPLLRAGAVQFLTSSGDFEVIGEANTAEDALELARRHHPDVAWLDIQLKGRRSGLDLARDLKTIVPDTRILIVSNYCNEPYVRAAMEIGIQGYLLKQTAPQEIIQAIHLIVGGGTVFASIVTEKLIDGYLNWAQGPSSRRSLGLSAREAQVLELVATGLENREVADKLQISLKAVEGFLKSIYDKLGANNRIEAVTTAVRRGLIVLES